MDGLGSFADEYDVDYFTLQSNSSKLACLRPSKLGSDDRSQPPVSKVLDASILFESIVSLPSPTHLPHALQIASLSLLDCP